MNEKTDREPRSLTPPLPLNLDAMEMSGDDKQLVSHLQSQARTKEL
jgi:hypothetical protein